MGVDIFKFYQVKQKIVVSVRRNDTFPASFPNICVNYPLGEMKIGNKSWTN